MSKMEGRGGKRRVFELSQFAKIIVERAPIRCGEFEGNGDRKSRVVFFSCLIKCIERFSSFFFFVA